MGSSFSENVTNHVYIRVSDMKNNTISLDDLHYISDEVYEKIKNYIITTDDIYMTIVGATIGKCGIIPDCLNNMNLTENAARIIPFLVDKHYLLMCLTTDFCQTQFIEKTKQVGVQKMALTRFSNSILPLPPLEEQKRIVAAIEKFMPLIEEYGKKETELKAFNEQIGLLTKKAILQEAVQGKLVPQIAAEGNAKDLLEEIRRSRHSELVSESKSKAKKEKTLPEITEDEIPFDIPESWCWCRLGEIVQLTSGQDLQPEMYNSSQKGIPYITGASNFNNGNVIINRWTETPKSVAIKDDLLLTCKGTVGEMAFLKEKKVHIARQVMSIRSSEKISLGYVKIYLTTQIENLKSKAKSMIPGIAREDVISSLFPLPPLAEQKRIVGAIEKLLPLCEKLGS